MGWDNIVTRVLTGDEIVELSKKMREIGLREFGKPEGHFTRDAANILQAQAIVLIGVKRAWYGLSYCSMCGFENCGECKKADANCAFAPMDLGIALSSAVCVAADMRIVHGGRVFGIVAPLPDNRGTRLVLMCREVSCEQ